MMGFGMILAGFILLFNPVIHVVDPVPDVIGFLMIAVGLTKMSFFIGKIEQARMWFLRLALVEAVKFCAILTVPYASGSDIVLMTFVFGMAEAFMFVPAMNDLAEGLSFAGLWYNGTVMYEKKVFRPPFVKLRVLCAKIYAKITKKGGKARAERVRKVEWITYVRDQVIFFYIFRICATLIPELTELQMYDRIGEVTAFSRSLTYYKPFLYVSLSLIVLILGIRYIRTVQKFFRAMDGDEGFLRSMNEKYERDIVPLDTFFIARGMKFSMALFVAAAATSVVLNLDNINMLVGVISAGFLIAATVILKRYVPQAKVIIYLSAVRGVLSLVNLVLQYDYYVEYTTNAIEFVAEAKTMYYRMAGLEMAEAIFAAAGMLLYMFFLLRAVKIHLPVCGIRQENAMYSKRNHDIMTYNTAGGKLLLCAVLAFINFILAGAYHYIIVNMTFIGLINTVVTVVWAFYVWHTVNTINAMLYDEESQIL